MIIINKGEKFRKIFISVSFLVIIIICIISSVFVIVNTLNLVNEKMMESAKANLNQSIGQLEYTISATWESDEANVREMASVLANADNKDFVMKNLKRNDEVFRYLYVENEQNEGIASDGENLKRDDSHIFTPCEKMKPVEVSEIFKSKTGKWSYLYRCPVEKDGQVFGWIYAQYLFDRLSFFMPENVYEGGGNCFILDIKTKNIVYQHDKSNNKDLVGIDLDGMLDEFRINDRTNRTLINSAISNNKDEMISVKIKDENCLVYIRTVSNEEFCIIGVVKESAIQKEAKFVRKTILVIISSLLVAILVIALIIFYSNFERKKIMRLREMEREEHNKQLQSALKAADAANQSKSEFLANMSHEIRTPINAVIGMNEMIIRESSEKEILGYAADIDSAARALLHIINDILDISKIESGKIELISVEYSLGTLVNELVSVISMRAKSKNLKLEIKVDSNLPKRLIGDDIRIRQIITNLLTNAVKYTNEGTVTLDISGKIDGDSVLLGVSVIDTGIGIKPEDLPKLTEKFQRIEESRNRNVEGTGLGMSITVSLLSIMDSRLEVESEYGKGSKFSFVIRQKIADLTPVGDISNRIRRIDGDERRRFKTPFTAPDAKILVVDDNEMNLKVFMQLLKQTKMQIDTAKSGRQCIEMAENKGYDIIFLDHMMPDMDGIETLNELRNNNIVSDDTPIVALTANAIVGAKEIYIEAGFTDYLSKPIEYERLNKMLINLLPDKLIYTDL